MDSVSIVFAFFLDMVIGDPDWFPHPVKGIGHIISSLENFLRKIIDNKKIGGIILTAAVLSMTYISLKILVNLAGMIHHFALLSVNTLIIYSSISIKDMYKESMGVYSELLNKDIAMARKRLARIVGRDTESLSEADIVRGTVESTAESIVDGIISPLFFACIGGAPLAAVYRAVNTLDSMVGYKNEKYSEFGWASAKVDDIANYIPARISGVLIPAAAFFCKKNWAYSLLTVINDRKKHPSPNSGFSEAGMAGALEVQLGGDSYYDGVKSEKPFIGISYRELKIKDILEANRIMFITSFIVIIFFCYIKI